ncbi:hypothetical protein CPB84DRAFT_1849475 [Gymnopilus junonius]|uniref:Uncharacterized protein n=1 Tax=Gymnopilus junonius TaxID=109634 RepID=A0A9P5TJM9_GYMJU|nr:hypothetical protein CPB84DRAFT_1849475 [Gymnopilus junonius]
MPQSSKAMPKTAKTMPKTYDALKKAQLALGVANKEKRELEKAAREKEIKSAKSSRSVTDSTAETLATEIRHEAIQVEFLEDPFLMKARFSNLEMTSLKPDDPAQYAPENMEKRLAAALFFRLSVKFHNDLLQSSAFVTKIARVVIYGQTCYKRKEKAIRKDSAFAPKYKLVGITAGCIAWCSVGAIYLLSNDREFQSPGEGEDSEINYRNLFEAYKQIIIMAKQKQPVWYNKLMKKWMKEVFPRGLKAGDRMKKTRIPTDEDDNDNEEGAKRIRVLKKEEQGAEDWGMEHLEAEAQGAEGSHDIEGNHEMEGHQDGEGQETDEEEGEAAEILSSTTVIDRPNKASNPSISGSQPRPLQRTFSFIDKLQPWPILQPDDVKSRPRPCPRPVLKAMDQSTSDNPADEDQRSLRPRSNAAGTVPKAAKAAKSRRK